MNLPSKVRFLGLRREFNRAVAAIRGLAISYAKLIIAILDIENRLEALEKRADMNDMLNGLQARYDEIIIESEVEETKEETDEAQRTED